MKKLYFMFFVLGLSLSMIFAQPCSIDPTLTAPGIYPDTVTNLPVGAETQYYEAVIRAVIPADTTINGQNVHIDSIGITGIDGLPSGFTYACGRPSCYILGGTQGCILISGTPAVGQAGIYPLLVKILIKATFNGLPVSMPDTLKGYRIRIDDSTHVGLLENLSSEVFIYPNPAFNVLYVDLYNLQNANGTLTIKDIQGRMVYQQQMLFVQGQQKVEIPITAMTNGVYFLRIVNDKEVIEKKFFVIQ
jgi:hypothetical protein